MLIAGSLPRGLVCTRHAGTRQCQIPIRNPLEFECSSASGARGEGASAARWRGPGLAIVAAHHGGVDPTNASDGRAVVRVTLPIASGIPLAGSTDGCRRHGVAAAS